jgi:hypothetical protein
MVVILTNNRKKHKKDSKKVTASLLSMLATGTGNFLNSFDGRFDFSNLFSQSVSAKSSLTIHEPYDFPKVLEVLNEENKKMVESVDFQSSVCSAYTAANDPYQHDSEIVKFLLFTGQSYNHGDEYNPSYPPRPFDFTSMTANQANWGSRVRSLPPVAYQRVAGMQKAFRLDRPVTAALLEFAKRVCNDNAGMSLGELVRNVDFRSKVDYMFGDFVSDGFLSSMSHLGGGNLETIKASERLDEIILESGIKDVKLTLLRLFDFAKKYPAVPASVASLLLFPLTRAMVTSIFLDTKKLYERFRQRFLYNRAKYSSNPEKMMTDLINALNEKIIGQPEAIHSLVKLIVGQIVAGGIKNPDKKFDKKGPLLIVLTGPSGVGKTETCRLISQAIFGNDMDPSQFITNQSIQAGTGDITPAEKLLSENSQLTIDLQRNPRRMIFFDEIDKYNDPDHTVLEVFGRGKDSGTLPIRMKDGTVLHVDISEAVFVFTTNQLLSCWGGKDSKESLEDPTRTRWVVNESLAKRFNVIEFKKLGEKSYKKILHPLINSFTEECKKRYGIECVPTSDFISKLAEECVLADKGARGCNDLAVEICGSFIEYMMYERSKNEDIKLTKVDFDFDKRFVFSRPKETLPKNN